jgi:hypothetical protein
MPSLLLFNSVLARRGLAFFHMIPSLLSFFFNSEGSALDLSTPDSFLFPLFFNSVGGALAFLRLIPSFFCNSVGGALGLSTPDPFFFPFLF